MDWLHGRGVVPCFGLGLSRCSGGRTAIAQSACPTSTKWGVCVLFGLRFVEQLVISACRRFCFVSGFFVAFAAGRSQRTIGWNVVGIRIKNLLIPFVLWSLIFLLVDLVQGDTFQPEASICAGLCWAKHGVVLLRALLIQFYLLSPLLVLVAKRHWKLLLVVSLILQFELALVSICADPRVEYRGDFSLRYESAHEQIFPRVICSGFRLAWSSASSCLA